jgi:hypothetical protein
MELCHRNIGPTLHNSRIVVPWALVLHDVPWEMVASVRLCIQLGGYRRVDSSLQGLQLLAKICGHRVFGWQQNYGTLLCNWGGVAYTMRNVKTFETRIIVISLIFITVIGIRFRPIDREQHTQARLLIQVSRYPLIWRIGCYMHCYGDYMQHL